MESVCPDVESASFDFIFPLSSNPFRCQEETEGRARKKGLTALVEIVHDTEDFRVMCCLFYLCCSMNIRSGVKNLKIICKADCWTMRHSLSIFPSEGNRGPVVHILPLSWRQGDECVCGSDVSQPRAPVHRDKRYSRPSPTAACDKPSPK